MSSTINSEVEKEVLELLRFARAYCASTLPWFSTALYRCKIHLRTSVPVAAIDLNLNVYFNPESILTIRDNDNKENALAQLGFLWIHEISHILREHAERNKIQKADAKLWNIVADLEINDSKWKGLKPPRLFEGVFPKQFNFAEGHIAEYYLKLLRKPDNQEQLDKILSNSKLDEGSGVHHNQRPWEIDNIDAQEIDSLEAELIRMDVAKKMQKSIGNISAGWTKWANQKMKPKVDWRKVLRHKLKLSINNSLGAKVDYTFGKLSRRQSVFHPIHTPSLRGDATASIAVVIDTSGSMSSNQVGQAVSEVCQILETFHNPVTVIPCDAKAYTPIKITSSSDYFKLYELQGGGGTDMIKGIMAALELKPKPDTILVLTDGYTPYPNSKFHTPVIFGIIDYGIKNYALPPNPPWGKDHTVLIDLSDTID